MFFEKKKIYFLMIILFLLGNFNVGAQLLSEEEEKAIGEEGIVIDGLRQVDNYYIFSDVLEEKMGVALVIGKDHFSLTRAGIENTFNEEGDFRNNPVSVSSLGTMEVIFNEAGTNTGENFIQLFEGKYHFRSSDSDWTEVIDSLIVRTKKGEIGVKKNRKNKFVLDENGIFTTGTKFVSAGGKANLRGYEIEMPKGARVEYFEDRIVIVVGNGEGVKTKTIGDEEGEGIIEVRTEDIGSLKLNGEIIQSKTLNAEKSEYENSESVVFYEFEDKKIRTYMNSPQFEVLNEDGEKEFVIFNEPFDTLNKIYIVNDENGWVDLKHNLLLKKDRVGLISFKGVGPFLKVEPSNRLGIGKNEEGGNDLEDQALLKIRSKNGGAIFNMRDGEKIPFLTMDGDSEYYFGEKSIGMLRNNDGTREIRFRPGVKIPGEALRYKSAPLEVLFFDDNGDYLRNEEGEMLRVITNALGGHRVVKGHKIENPNYFESFRSIGILESTPPDDFVSSGVALNQLSDDRKVEFLRFDKEEQNELIEKYLNVGGVGALQREIDRRVGDFPMRDKFLHASVELEFRIEGKIRGGSGTIVGTTKRNGEEYSIVLTAGHVVEGTGDLFVHLNTLEEKYRSTKKYEGAGIHAEVVAVSPQTKYDLALVAIKTTPEIKKRGFVEIDLEKRIAKGNRMLIGGCPGFGSTFYASSCQVTWVKEYNHLRPNVVHLDFRGAGGQSGGGVLNSNGKISSVVQAADGRRTYSSSQLSLREFLEINPEYSFLIGKLILIMLG